MGIAYDAGYWQNRHDPSGKPFEFIFGNARAFGSEEEQPQ